MSVYTTQIRWILESGATLSLDAYPIFQDAYREVLNQKIIDHFYFREIGFETVALFNNRLAARMNEVMPYFNKLYETQLLSIDPLITKKYTETFTRNATDKRETGGIEHRKDENGGESKVSGSRSNNEIATEQTIASTKAVGSDTPQGLLRAASLDDDVWASSATRGENSEKTNSTHTASESTTTDTESSGKASSDIERTGTDDLTKWEEFTRSIEGFDGTSQAELILKFRETLINVDQLIFNALEDLFMQLW